MKIITDVLLPFGRLELSDLAGTCLRHVVLSCVCNQETETLSSHEKNNRRMYIYIYIYRFRLVSSRGNKPRRPLFERRKYNYTMREAKTKIPLSCFIHQFSKHEQDTSSKSRNRQPCNASVCDKVYRATCARVGKTSTRSPYLSFLQKSKT